MSLSVALQSALSESNPRSGHDACVLAIHVSLVDKGYQPSRVKEIDPVSVDKPFELPKGWNTQETYVIFYSKDRSEYVLKILKMDDDLCCGFMAYGGSSEVPDSNVASWILSVGSHISDSSLYYKETHISNLERITAGVEENLLKDPTRGRALKRSEEPARHLDRHDFADRQVQPGMHFPSSSGLASGVQRVGDADRFPGGFGGGGMIFDPRGALAPGGIHGGGVGGRLPRAPVPPGARYDPVYPMGDPNFHSPDTDHLPMPGFENPLHGRPPNPFGPPSGPGMGGRGPGLGGRGPGFGGHGPGFGDFY